MPDFHDRGTERLERILVLVNGKRDGEVTRDLLVRDGLDVTLCADVAMVVSEITRGAAVVLLAEEALTPAAVKELEAALIRQQPWSDLPIVVFSAAGKSGVRDFKDAARALGNVTFLDRPVQVRSLLAAIHAGIRARFRQYEGRRAIESRDAFLATLGHELRNPLSAISLAIATVIRNTPEAARPKQYDIIERQSRHLGRLVDDLLDVARVTHGKLVITREPLNVSEVVRGTFDALESRSIEQGLSWELELPEDGIFVLGDCKYLEQVFSNILLNALKFTPRGGSVRVNVRLEGDHVAVSVKDSGVGIAPEMLDRIFETFVQADRSMDRADGGIGLGLALVRSVVLLHGGTVEAQSAGLGSGTTLIVRLPVTRAPETERRESPCGEPRPPSKRIVVIEDNTDIRELLFDLLSFGGHDVSCASDGPAGLTVLLQESPDIAFIDLGLPGFDGLELARRARASGSKTWLVALTGYGQPEDKERARRAGFDQHLTKPVQEADVRRALLQSERATQ